MSKIGMKIKRATASRLRSNPATVLLSSEPVQLFYRGLFMGEFIPGEQIGVQPESIAGRRLAEVRGVQWLGQDGWEADPESVTDPEVANEHDSD